MYKVFFNDRLISINSKQKDTSDCIEITSSKEMSVFLFHFFKNEDDAHICSTDTEQVFSWLKNELNYLEAAGGIVENEDEELLFIYRLGFWDLPKGKIEKGESAEQAAYREIKEECGIQSHQIQSHLCNTYHIYSMNGQMHLKKTFWYHFLLQDLAENGTPQTEEDIEQISWFTNDEITLALLDSYPSIHEVYNAFLEK